MKNIFKIFSKEKQSINNNVEVLELPKKELIKSMNEIIEEIHDTFYTEVDRLLENAKISKSLDTDKQDLIDKCARLKALGFTNTKEVKDAELEIERLNQLKIENEANKDLTEAINYFGFKYPNYKFITEDSVKKICQKYNLVYGTIDKYIGSVPDKNLKHIEEFKIKEDDCVYYKYEWSIGMFSGDRVESFKILNFNEYKKLKFPKEIIYHDDMPILRFHPIGHWVSDYITSKMEIVAPLKDFNMKDHEIKDFKLSKIEILDPVVLHPVMFKDKKYYLIVTAWGLESQDELVVNQKFN